ncbi:hypothetical protein FNF27_03054 [Cafeteria roenbergensis]|uniref:EF-hand domain-containing protein n=1 Tax=Cafeteria roenbergensis TaxID=33653 RepID=A0A5A8EHT8_CAFRO|nr:hypothetical protein FNF27_03054 [Cafeteria roenbergensis]
MSQLMRKSCEPDLLHEADAPRSNSAARVRRRRSEDFDTDNMSPTASIPAAKRLSPQSPCDTLATESLWERGVHASGISFAYEHCSCGPASVVSAAVLRHLMHGAGGARPCSGVRGVFNFEDFVRFSLAQADRMRTTSCIYWMRALDLDHDGVVGARDLEQVHSLRQQEAEFRYGCGWEQCSSLSPWAKIPTGPFLHGMGVFARGRERFRPGGAHDDGGGGAGDKDDFPKLTAASLLRRRPGGTERGWTFFSSVLAVDGCNGLQDALRFLHEEADFAASSEADQGQMQEAHGAAGLASAGVALTATVARSATGSSSPGRAASRSTSGSEGGHSSQRAGPSSSPRRNLSASPRAVFKNHTRAAKSRSFHDDGFGADDAAVPGAASEGSEAEASAAARPAGASSAGDLFGSAGDFASPALPLHRPVELQQSPSGVVLLHNSRGHAGASVGDESSRRAPARPEKGMLVIGHGTSSASGATLPGPTWTLVPASSGGCSTAPVSGGGSGSTGFSPMTSDSGHSIVLSAKHQSRRLPVEMPATIAEGD